MGHRTLKRVPLDFEAPIDKVWEGYINPYPDPLECDHCSGNGCNTATQQIANDYYDHVGDGDSCWGNNITQDEVQALLDADRLWEFTRVPLNDEQLEVIKKRKAEGGNRWLPYNNGYIPTADEVNEWNQKPGLHGNDSINRWILIEARAKRLGVYGKCQICNGEGTLPHPDRTIRKLHKDWKEYEPPTGEGYQLWKTSIEGIPASPVFARVEDLADWCSENATIFADEKISSKKWLKMFVGEEDLETGSLMCVQEDYVGSIANIPKC